ncbi:MAG TPA: SbcC/MukB-like Walker B domain-containing protein, partial [Labilithrix sp.]|nr:SbcC/MukB-like Walker B domain-containing protein [Labilithrix sp.]
VRARALALGLARDGDPSVVATRALAAADAEVRACEDELHALRTRAADASRRADEARAEAEALEATIPRWEALEPAISRLDVRTPEDVPCKRNALFEQRERMRGEVQASEDRRVTLLREAELLDNAGGFPHDLLAVRDVLGAELLASRFETSSAEDAPALEAALGPLAHALVVTDPGLAADALAQIAESPATVWLVAEEDVPRIVATAQGQLGSSESIDVVVKETHALRITRRPSRPILGREARARRAAPLRAEAKGLEEAISKLLEALRQLDGQLRDADRLLGEAVLLAAGDPAPVAVGARQREKAARLSATEAADAARGAEERARDLRTRLADVLELVADAHHLGARDPEARVLELERARSAAESAAKELARSAPAREILAEKLDALRHAPPNAGRDADGERKALESERDRLFAAESALADVITRKDTLGWEDLDVTLADRSSVRASIEAQHEAARVATSAAEDALRGAESAWERANLAWQTALADRASREIARGRLRSELDEQGGLAAAAVSVEALDESLATFTRERDGLVARERELSNEIAVVKERRVQAEKMLVTVRAAAGEVEATCGPLQNEWRTFAELAEASGVLASDGPSRGRRDGRLPADHLAEAKAQRVLLSTQLEHARGGADGAAAVKAAFDRAGETAHAYLEAWLAARAWVMRRLPAQFADVADPSEALERLRTNLGSLEGRVVHHETELRGSSEDVARGIDVQLRKTATRVRRLNRDLADVAFGSIGAIRVQVKRVERMELVLKALRGGEVQELLFQSKMPFEDALAEVFRRYGGGGRSGTQKILDYREYLDLVVEVQRRSSAPNEWEVASPTRLSTGEAIGVGAALMMVVLMEWERDANLLRSDRPTGTLRFLFLDEANRLSPDNLAVLFDLCHALDLQLLIAAPEVARAFGNTTYRLVRHVDPSGREEVLVSGRRAVPRTSESDANTPAPSNDDN